MGPQWRERADRQQSLLGHSGCRIGGNDLDIALAFKCLMPLLGMGRRNGKAPRCRSSCWKRRPSTTCQRRATSTAPPTAVCLTDLLRSARCRQVALLKVSASVSISSGAQRRREQKSPSPAPPSVETALPFIRDELAHRHRQRGLEAALDQPLTPHYGTECSSRSIAARPPGRDLSYRRRYRFRR